MSGAVDSGPDTMRLAHDERADFADFLATLTPEQWKHYGVHNERGSETIETIVRMFAGHDLNHFQQIERILAAKK